MKKKILIIDESEEIHEKLGKFLEEKGYEVYHSFDGEEGIDKIFKIFPDCVILEILLPKKLGIEIVRECKISPKVQKIAFIFYTILYLREEEIERGIFLKGNFYSFKVDAYFQKPTESEIIFKKIKEILGEKEIEKEIYKILIIENEFEIISSLKKILEEKNYIVEYAMNAKEGLIKLEEFKPNLILLDYILPDADGVEILSKIKEKEEIPVIMITPYGAEDVIVFLLKRGADNYISKPLGGTREILLKIEENLKKVKRTENILISKMLEMNHFLIDSYFKKEDIEKKLSSIEKEIEKKFLKKIEEINEKYFNLKENIVLIKNDMDLLIKNFEETLSDIREKFYNLKPEEEKFPEKVRELTGKIREGLQKIEALIYKIKDKIYKL